MSQRELVRTYRHTDAAFIQLCDSIMDSARRDITELENYGVTVQEINDLELVRDGFLDAPSDEVLSGIMIYATQEKDRKREDILLLIRQIGNRARIHFGEDSASFRRFGMGMLSRNNDNELYRTARIVVLAATEYLALLAPMGLTIEIINELDVAAVEFNDLLDLKQIAVSNRDIAVENRIKLGNEMHERLRKISAKGKLCWEDRNQALYNDYFLSQERSRASVTAGNVPKNSRVNVSVTGIRRASVLKIGNTGTVGIEVYFGQDPTAVQGAVTKVVSAGSSIAFTALEYGYDAPKGRKHLMVYNPHDSKGSYSIEWGG